MSTETANETTEENTANETEEENNPQVNSYLRRWGMLSWAILAGFIIAIFGGFRGSTAGVGVSPRLLALLGLTLIWHGVRGIAGEPKRLFLFGIPAYLFAILLAFYFTVPVNLLIAGAGVLGLYFAWKAYRIS